MGNTVKSMFSIGSIATFLDTPQYVLRYWEKEFNDFINPSRTQGNQRRYTDNDLATFQRIKKMLYDDKYSIAGARQALRKKDLHDQVLLRKRD